MATVIETPPKAPKLALQGSRLFTTWLGQARASLAFSTYQAGKLFFIGLKEDGSLSVFERTFARSMGLAVGEGHSLFLASLYQLWRFENFLGPGETHQGHDALFVPLEARTTGDVDIHDIGIGADGRPVFAATLFNCLATLDDRHSFAPLWRPRFIDRLVPEDRCHLNGLAMREGRPAFVTAVGETNVAEAWRSHRHGGGVLIDVDSSEIVCRGLSMPHSPRLKDGQLYLLNAGTGEVGRVDLAAGRFDPIAFCPGFLRGLTIIGDHAVVGLSKLREDSSFAGLPLTDRLKAEGIEAECGLRVIDLRTGAVSHSLKIDGVVEELYDVVALPGLIRPAALGLRTDEIRTVLKPKTEA